VVGSVRLSRDANGRVVALTGECPHLGCQIRLDAGSGLFRRPCHKSAFTPGGERLSGPAKRGLDPLPVEEPGGRIRVRFVRYRADIAERITV